MKPFALVLTLDYELPAGGATDVARYVTRPTERLLDICEMHGARLTIMLEIGELWAFEATVNNGFRDYLGYDPAESIRTQLSEAVARGHDVQLHLHPHWLDARWIDERWSLDYRMYRITDLNENRIAAVLRRGREELESLLRPWDAQYECLGFRAGNWNTAPSRVYLSALQAAGISSDTSVFKWGFSESQVARFDYRKAQSPVIPWLADPEDICRCDSAGRILEIPIYAEPSNLLGMLTLKRLLVAGRYLREDRANAREVDAVAHVDGPSTLRRVLRARGATRGREPSVRAKKLDFGKLTAREMLGMVRRAVHEYESPVRGCPVPIVAIGHSKDSQSFQDLSSFLTRAGKEHADVLAFSTYRDVARAWLTRGSLGSGASLEVEVSDGGP